MIHVHDLQKAHMPTHMPYDSAATGRNPRTATCYPAGGGHGRQNENHRGGLPWEDGSPDVVEEICHIDGSSELDVLAQNLLWMSMQICMWHSSCFRMGHYAECIWPTPVSGWANMHDLLATL